MNTEKPIRRQAIETVVNFVTLVHAHEHGETRKARAAHEELKRLGVRVIFTPKAVPA